MGWKNLDNEVGSNTPDSVEIKDAKDVVEGIVVLFDLFVLSKELDFDEDFVTGAFCFKGVVFLSTCGVAFFLFYVRMTTS